jgi:hypothetical protein
MWNNMWHVKTEKKQIFLGSLILEGIEPYLENDEGIRIKNVFGTLRDYDEHWRRFEYFEESSHWRLLFLFDATQYSATEISSDNYQEVYLGSSLRRSKSLEDFDLMKASQWLKHIMKNIREALMQ